MKLAWFAGHFLVVLSSLLYLTSFKQSRTKTLSYRLVFLGSLDSFGIVIYQTTSLLKGQNQKLSIKALSRNDDIHYLLYSFIWLLLPTKNLLAIIPLFSFSLFHVLNYFATDLLPAFQINGSLNEKIINFTRHNHDSSRRISANVELLLLIQLFFKALFFVKYSWISLLGYLLFIKLKTETSIFTKAVLKNWEVRVDGVVSAPNIPPVVKTQWLNIKNALKQADRISISREIDQKTS